MKKLFGFVLAASIMFLGSCATTPSLATMQADTADFQLPKTPTGNMAMVYVVRPTMLGLAIRFEVYVDKKQKEYSVGSTLGGQYIYFEVSPGSRIILSQAENLASYEFTAEASKLYFIEQDPRMGILFARNEIIPLQDAEGKYWVKRLRPGEIKN